MKQVITNYSFNTTAKTITLTDFGASHPVDLKRLYLITDVTTNKVLYNFADSTVASVTISSNNVITLSALQGGESNTDALQIVYEVLATDPSYQLPLLPSGAAQDGTDATGVTPTSGASGIRGWLSGIFNKLTGTLTVTDTAAESSLSTISTNTGNSATSANQTNGNQQSKITDGTNTANVVAPGTANSTGNALLSAMTTQSVSFSSSITTGTANLASTDAGNYNIVAVQVTGLGSGAASLAFQGSNDNTNWYSVPVNRNSVTLSTPFTSTTAADMYTGALPFRYFRLQLSGQTGGTTSGVVTFKTGNYSPMTIAGQISINGTQAISGNVGSAYATGSAVPANAFYLGINGGNLTGVSAIGQAADGATGNGAISSGLEIYNGSTYDRQRSANAAANTTGTGLLGTGPLSVARTALPSAATNGNYMQNYADKFGRQVVISQTTRDLVGVATVTVTSSTTAATLIAAAGAGVFTDITDITLVNISATATEVQISDGTNTYEFYAPAGDMRGISLQVPHPATTANTAWTITTVTSIASLKATVKYIKNQ